MGRSVGTVPARLAGNVGRQLSEIGFIISYFVSTSTPTQRFDVVVRTVDGSSYES